MGTVEVRRFLLRVRKVQVTSESERETIIQYEGDNTDDPSNIELLGLIHIRQLATAVHEKTKEFFGVLDWVSTQDLNEEFNVGKDTVGCIEQIHEHVRETTYAFVTELLFDTEKDGMLFPPFVAFENDSGLKSLEEQMLNQGIGNFCLHDRDYVCILLLNWTQWSPWKENRKVLQNSLLQDQKKYDILKNNLDTFFHKESTIPHSGDLFIPLLAAMYLQCHDMLLTTYYAPNDDFFPLYLCSKPPSELQRKEIPHREYAIISYTRTLPRKHNPDQLKTRSYTLEIEEYKKGMWTIRHQDPKYPFVIKPEDLENSKIRAEYNWKALSKGTKKTETIHQASPLNKPRYSTPQSKDWSSPG